MKVVFAGLAVKLPVGKRVSQLLVVQVCSETWAVVAVLVDAVTVRVWVAGADPPATAVNGKVDELNVRGGAVAVTFRVTLAVCVVEPAAAMEIVPVHVVPAESPAGLTETVRFVFDWLAVKLPGEMVSQLLLGQGCSETWAVAPILPDAVTVSAWVAGADPPATAANVKAEELNVRVGAAVTLRVTLAVCVVEPAAMEIVPVHVVPAAIPDGLTKTVKFVFDGPAVKLPVGEMVSQLLLAQVCSETWVVALVLADAVTASVFESGADPPATAVKVKAEGLRVSVDDAAVTVRVMLKVSEPWLELTTILLV